MHSYVGFHPNPRKEDYSLIIIQTFNIKEREDMIENKQLQLAKRSNLTNLAIPQFLPKNHCLPCPPPSLQKKSQPLEESTKAP